MNIDLEKKQRNLDDYIDYVNAQVDLTAEQLREDLLSRGLKEDEVDYVMSFYKPTRKQGLFSHPFSFHGRIRRLEYGLSLIIYYVYSFILETCLAESPDTEGFMTLLAVIPICWFMLAQGAKRCHGRGNSGWFQIIPFYGLWMLFGDGEKRGNIYGSNPKGLNNGRL